MVENPVKPSITKSRKNLDKQNKIDYSLLYRDDRSANSGGILIGVRDNIKNISLELSQENNVGQSLLQRNTNKKN